MSEIRHNACRLMIVMIIFTGYMLRPGKVWAQDKTKTYRFDFGTGKTAPGYKQVTAVTRYGDGQNYGWDYEAKAVCRDRGGNNALKSDFCTSPAPMFFSVKVPEGTYEVTVTLGDAWRPSTTTIKAESRRLMVKEVTTAPGEFRRVSFMVSVWDSVISGNRVVNLKPRERNKLDWDNKLTLEFNNSRPSVNAVKIREVNDAITVFLSGNSTVTDQRLEPWAAWGQMFPYFFKSGKVVIANHAASGATLRSTINRGRLANIASLIEPGDYLFIEFAHNDQKPGSGEEPYTTYNKYMRVFINTAREHQAIPVLVTSTARRIFDSDGDIKNTLDEYPDAMRYEGQRSDVALIDLNAMSKTLYEALGPQKAKELFVVFSAGTFPGQKEVLADHTHFNNFGAYEMARCVVEGIRKSELELVKYLKSGLPSFEPAHPDSYKKWHLPLTPMYVNDKYDGNWKN